MQSFWSGFSCVATGRGFEKPLNMKDALQFRLLGKIK